MTIVQSQTLPATGHYAIDLSHSAVEFSVRHLGLSKVRGRFGSFTGTLEVSEEPTQSSVAVSLDAASFTTGSDDRDNHVRSADFLDVEAFPVLTFRSVGVRDDDGWKVDGELTIRDVTRPVTLDVEFEGSGRDPWGGERIGFTAETEIDRDEFGITWNQALETGGVLVGKKVKIHIDVEAVRTES